MTRANASTDSKRTRLTEGCADATVELWTGGCKVLGNLFMDLGDALARPDRQQRRDSDEKDPTCVADCSETTESVGVSVGRAVENTGKVMQRAADACISSTETSSEAQTESNDTPQS